VLVEPWPLFHWKGDTIVWGRATRPSPQLSSQGLRFASHFLCKLSGSQTFLSEERRWPSWFRACTEVQVTRSIRNLLCYNFLQPSAQKNRIVEETRGVSRGAKGLGRGQVSETGQGQLKPRMRSKESQITMSSTKHKLRLAGAFAALAIMALAVGCKGFFPPEQLGTITIQPATANVPLGGTFQLQAFGTNTDTSSAGNITGQVSWSSSSGTVGVNGSGLLAGNDLSSTPATITASAQGVSATSTATVCLENGTNFTIIFTPSTAVVGASETAEATASVGSMTGVDISSGVTWSTNNTSVLITAGDPATIDTSGLVITSATQVIIFATYTCNGVNNNFQATLTVDPS
jgi:hypothetical protein